MMTGFSLCWLCVSIFFFSSRRRHTRYWRDWSSDVCSSDLACRFELADGGTLFLDEIGALDADCQTKLLTAIEEKRFTPRSEERRVGKECRSRWSRRQ